MQSLQAQPTEPSPADIALLFEIELFSGLSCAEKKQVLSEMQFYALDAGRLLGDDHLDDTRVYFLVRGHVAIHRADAYVGYLNAPDVLGLVSALDEAPRQSAIVSVGPAAVFSIKKELLNRLLFEDHLLVKNVILELSRRLRNAYSREDDLQRNLHDFFVSPNARIVPGPYYCEDFGMKLFLMRGDRKEIRSLIPEGLSPIPGANSLFIVGVSDFPGLGSLHPVGEGRRIAYREISLFVPVLGPSMKAGDMRKSCVSACPI